MSDAVAATSPSGGLSFHNVTGGDSILQDIMSGSEGDHDSGSPLLGSFLAYFVQGLYGTVFMVGLVGNTLVIYVVLRFTKMQTVTNLYILNLAVADFTFLVGIPFIMTTMGLGFWPFGNVMCKVYMTTTSVNQFTSSLLLTVMSADRYLAVCHPISSPSFRTTNIAKIVSLVTWAISFLMIVPIFLYAHTQQQMEDPSGGVDWTSQTPGPAELLGLSGMNRTAFLANLTEFLGDASPASGYSPVVSCNIYWPENEYMNGQAAFTLYTFTLAFAIPLILILVFYILVIRKLQTVGPTNKSKEKKKSHRKVTRLVLTVVTVYVLCWLPYWVSQVSLIFTPPKSSQSVYMVAVFLLAGCLGYSNSAVNPILYAFLSDNFKKSFMKACTCAERREVNKMLAGENSVFTRRGNKAETKNEPKRISPARQAENNKTGNQPPAIATVTAETIAGAGIGSRQHIVQQHEADVMVAHQDNEDIIQSNNSSLNEGQEQHQTTQEEVAAEAVPLLEEQATQVPAIAVAQQVNGTGVLHSDL